MANKEISELTAASALAGDELVHVVQDGNSRKTTVDGIGTGIFRTTATWSDVQVASASFKIYNAAGTPRALSHDTTALTADRSITMPDSDIDLAKILPFKSTPQTITMSSRIVVAHGLGAQPTRINAKIVCTTTNAGYAVGDEVSLSSYYSASSGATVGADTTNVWVTFAPAYSIFVKTTGGNTSIVAASWQLVMEAWR